MAVKEENKIEDFKNLIGKIFGKESNAIIKDPENIVLPRFSTGSLKLDKDLKGGWVKGSVIEIYGDPGTGKTTLSIHAVAEHQKSFPNEPVLWVDLEKVFDPEYFKTIGININSENFILIRPSSGEDVWESIISFVKTFENGIVVLDSVAVLLPKKEDEGQVGDAQMALAARMNSQGFRKLFPYMGFGKTTFFAINQTRSNIGGYGDPTTTTGGKSWDFYARTRIQTYKTKGEAGEYSNNRFKQVKSNYGNQDIVTETAIIYGQGFDRNKELLSICVEEGVINKGGSWFSYGDTKLGQGADNVVEILNDNPELVEELLEKLRELKVL